MSLIQALVCVLLLVAACYQPTSAQNQQCRALSDSLPASCRILNDYYCDEVECFGSNLHGTLTLFNCDDPAEVQVALGDEDSDDYWSHLFAVTTEQTSCDLEMQNGNRLYATFSRNASHVQFEAHGIVEGDIATTIFPAMSIPLDLLSCTCDAMYRITDTFQLPILGATHSCNINDSSTCSDYHCYISYGNTNVESNAVIDPCSESITVTVTDTATREQVWQHVFSGNSSVQFTLLSFTPTVYVMIRHFEYSMTVSVKLKVYSYNTTVLPERKIILNRSSCTSLGTFPAAPFPYGNGDGCLADLDDYDYPYPTDLPSPNTPSSGPYVPHAKTCQALQKIASGSASQCSVVDSCTALECNFMIQYHAKLTIKTCNNPPAVGVVIHDASGDTILDETLINSRTQPIEFAGIHVFDLIISITHVKRPDSLVLKVSVHTPLGQDIVVIPDTSIPIDRCGCPGIACSSDDSSSGASGGSAGGGKPSKLVKILVPVGVLVLLLVVTAVVVLVVVGVVYAKKKQGRAYTFQRMTFNSVNEDVEEVDKD